MERDEQRSVDQFRSRLALLLLLKYSLTALTIWAFLYGTAALALRGSLGISRLDLLWGLTTLPLALLPAIWLTYRRIPSPERVRALLDRHARCGGLLMTADEQPLGSWQQAIPELHHPKLHWRAERSCGLLVAGLAFVAVAFLVPQSLASFVGNPLDVTKEAEKLSKQLQVLEQEKILEKQRATELKAKLEQVRREAKGKDPIKTLESLDHLQDVANKVAREASESALRKMEELGRAEAFAQAMERSAGKMDKQMLTEAMQEMAALAKRAANEQELLESGLDKETLEAIKNSTLTPEQTKKLLEALKNAKKSTKEKVGRLVKAKLIKAEDLAKCEKAGECDCEALVAYLKENGAQSDLTNELMEGEGEEGGRGGVTRGPGAAKLNFGDESLDDGTKFKEEELPMDQLKALKESQLSAISTGTPNVGRETAKQGASGALSGAKSGGGSASTQTVLPRHRGAVQRFFDRPAMPKK